MRQMKKIDYHDPLVYIVSHHLYSIASFADNDLRKLDEGKQKDLVFVRLLIERLNDRIVKVEKPIAIDSMLDLETAYVMNQVFKKYNPNFSGNLYDIVSETGKVVKRLEKMVSSVRNYKIINKSELGSLRDLCKTIERIDESGYPSFFDNSRQYMGLVA